MDKQEKLLSLYKRKKEVVSNMDGFQVAREIEDTVIDVLKEMFHPYNVARVYDERFGHMPDCEIEFEALGSKSRVFFEIKSGDLPEFELRNLQKMVRELGVLYSGTFHSLVVIARSFGDKLEIEEFCEKVYPGRVEFISAETLISILNVLKEEPELREIESQKLFLASLLKKTGVLSRDYVTTFDFSKLRSILEIRRKIAHLDVEEDSVSSLLASARQTLRYWEEQYQRLMRKKQLIQMRRELQRQLTWMRVNKEMQVLEEWKELINDVQEIRKDLHAAISIRPSSDKELKKLQQLLELNDGRLRKIELKIKTEYEKSSASLNHAKEEAIEQGPEVVAAIPLADLEKSIAGIDKELGGLADVSDDIGHMYNSYMKLFKELEEKAKELEIDRQKLRQLLREDPLARFLEE